MPAEEGAPTPTHTHASASASAYAYWKPYRTPNHSALNALWVLRFIEVRIIHDQRVLLALLASLAWALWRLGVVSVWSGGRGA